MENKKPPTEETGSKPSSEFAIPTVTKSSDLKVEFLEDFANKLKGEIEIYSADLVSQLLSEGVVKIIE